MPMFMLSMSEEVSFLVHWVQNKVKDNNVILWFNL